MPVEQSFEDAIAEYVERTQALKGKEVMESMPPSYPPGPFDQSAPPFEAALRLDSRTLSNYAMSIGEGNPLFADPEYGKGTRYGCQLAPGNILSVLRHPGSHGLTRPEGYPVAMLYTGTAFELFDVIRVDSRFKTSHIYREFMQKAGRTSATGKNFYLITELFFWDFHGDLIGKAYGVETAVPRRELYARMSGSQREAEGMMYERPAAAYTPSQIQEIIKALEGRKRRGADLLFWEDVQVGDDLGTLAVLYNLRGTVSWELVRSCVRASKRGEAKSRVDTEALSGLDFHWERAYYFAKANPGRHVWVHPITRWPWTVTDEHEDPLLAKFRGQPNAFDYGPQRHEFTYQLLSDWMGDNGFVRRMYVAVRKPVYNGDVSFYRGTVVKKFREKQPEEAGSNQVEYCAVGIQIEATNQVGEIHSSGTATVYLPSRVHGEVSLPVPHAAIPPYIPFDTFRMNWY